MAAPLRLVGDTLCCNESTLFGLTGCSCARNVFCQVDKWCANCQCSVPMLAEYVTFLFIGHSILGKICQKKKFIFYNFSVKHVPIDVNLKNKLIENRL